MKNYQSGTDLVFESVDKDYNESELHYIIKIGIII